MHATSAELSRLGIDHAFSDKHLFYEPIIVRGWIFKMKLNGFIQIANGFLNGFAEAGNIDI